MLPFQNLSPIEQNTIAEAIPTLVVEPGETLLTAGVVEGAAVLILSGTVGWFLDGAEIGRGGLGAVAGFGQLVWPDRPMPHTVRVLQRSEVMVLDDATLIALDQRGIGARDALERYALTQMAEAYRQLDELVQDLVAEQEDDWEPPAPSLLSQLKDLFGIQPDADHVDRLAALRASTLFADATDFALGQLAERMQPCAFDGGDRIGEQFTLADSLHIVVEGAIELGAAARPGEEPHPVGVLGPGGLSGAACVLGSIRVATAVARGRTVTLALDADTVRSLSSGATEAGTALRRALLRVTWEALSQAQIEVRSRMLIRNALEDHRSGRITDARALALLGSHGHLLEP